MGPFFKGLIFQGNKNDIREYDVDKCHEKVCHGGAEHSYGSGGLGQAFGGTDTHIKFQT